MFLRYLSALILVFYAQATRADAPNRHIELQDMGEATVSIQKNIQIVEGRRTARGPALLFQNGKVVYDDNSLKPGPVCYIIFKEELDQGAFLKGKKRKIYLTGEVGPHHRSTSPTLVAKDSDPSIYGINCFINGDWDDYTVYVSDMIKAFGSNISISVPHSDSPPKEAKLEKRQEPSNSKPQRNSSIRAL
jgi:hypothetical protein